MNLSFNLDGIYIAKEPIDFRAGIRRLSYIVADTFGADPCSQALYTFINRSKSKLKCLYYDGTGF